MNNDIKQEKIKQYMENLQRLDNGERAVLKRSLGQTISNADGRALSAFYKSLPCNIYPNEEEAYFLVGASVCFWKDASTQTKNFINCLRDIKDESGGMDRRLIALLDTDWNVHDSFFTGKISRLIRMLKQKGFSPDFAVLLKDLLLWNHPDRLVQRIWARAYFGDNNNQRLEIKEEN